METDKPFPQAIEAERALLGGLLQRSEELPEIFETCPPADFYRAEHRALAELLLAMHQDSQSVDLVTVADRITQDERGSQRFGGVAYVVELPEHVPSTANLPHYAAVIRRAARLREVIRTARDLAERAYAGDDPDELIDAVAAELHATQPAAADGWKTAAELHAETDAKIEAAQAGELIPLSTGIEDLDDQLSGGLRPEDLVVIGGLPGSGKTAFAMHLARALSHEQGARGAVVSLEMSAWRLGLRLQASETGIPLDVLINGRLDETQQNRRRRASAELAQWPLHVWDPAGATVAQTISRIRRLKREHNIEWVLVDYLTLLDAPTGARSLGEATAANSNALRALAKDLGITVIALAQLNDAWEKRGDEASPRLSDFAGSKQVGRDATAAIIIERQADVGTLHVVKARDGIAGPCGFGCNLALGRFYGLGDLL